VSAATITRQAEETDFTRGSKAERTGHLSTLLCVCVVCVCVYMCVCTCVFTSVGLYIAINDV